MMSEITRTAIQAPIAVAMASEMSRSQFHTVAQDLLRDFDRVTAENAALQQRLNAADQRADDLAEMLALASVSVDYHAGMKGEDGEHLYDLLARIRALFQNHVEHPLAMVEQDHTGDATEKVAQPFTEQFIEDHLGKLPQ